MTPRNRTHRRSAAGFVIYDPYCGRLKPDEELDRFEKLYIALYEPDGTDLRFFDIETDPPKNGRPTSDGELKSPDGRPRRLLTYGEFLEAVYHTYLQRNSADFRWADGEEAPLAVDRAEEEENPEEDGEES